MIPTEPDEFKRYVEKMQRVRVVGKVGKRGLRIQIGIYVKMPTGVEACANC
jgi:hypothetical protein